MNDFITKYSQDLKVWGYIFLSINMFFNSLELWRIRKKLEDK